MTKERLNAEIRAQLLPPEQPVVQSIMEPKASNPTRNKLENLKWVKRKSSTSEIKQYFWVQRQHQAFVPQKEKAQDSVRQSIESLKSRKKES